MKPQRRRAFPRSGPAPPCPVCPFNPPNNLKLRKERDFGICRDCRAMSQGLLRTFFCGLHDPPIYGRPHNWYNGFERGPKELSLVYFNKLKRGKWKQ